MRSRISPPGGKNSRYSWVTAAMAYWSMWVTKRGGKVELLVGRLVVAPEGFLRQRLQVVLVLGHEIEVSLQAEVRPSRDTCYLDLLV